MDKSLRDELEKFLSKNFAIQTETTGTSICAMKYNKNKIRREINVVFTRYYHADEPSEYVMTDVGYVLVVPSFWMSVSRPLVMAYIESYIDSYFNEYIFNKKEDNKPADRPDYVPSDAYIPPKHPHPQRPPRKPAPMVPDNPFGVPTELASIGVNPEDMPEGMVKPISGQQTGSFKDTTRQ